MHIPFLLLCAAGLATCWEMELFDLVEEINTDFYTLLGVQRSADFKEIRQAFKKLSLQLHPDKNDAPDAGVAFRQLVDVYNVLKDSDKRRSYNDVLDNGLPDWRHAVYYYRRVRKMGLLEMLTIVFVIVTIGQYITSWAAYWEKQYTINEYVETQRKRLLKKQKKGKIDELPDMAVEIPRPSVVNTLPFQICKLAWFTIVSIPLCVSAIFKIITEKKEVKEESSEDEVEVEETWTKGPRRRRNFVIPEGRSTSPQAALAPTPVNVVDVSPAAPVAGGLWTDDDLTELIKLVNKFPPGTSKRWEKVAEAMSRPVNEVIHMSKKVKEGLVPRSDVASDPVPAVPKVKTKGGKVGALDAGGESEWSSAQQKSLEDALVKFPKQIGERWDKIARAVPGKTKEECMLRFKTLAEAVRKKKEAGPAEH